MNLEEILKSSKNIEISFFTEEDKKITLKTLIDMGFSYDNNKFSVIAPRHKGFNYPFRHGDVVTIIFTTIEKEKKKVFSFKGEIIKKTKENDMIEDIIKKIGEVEEIQRRSAFRLPITKNAYVETDDEKYEVLSKNISAGGLRFIVNEKFNAGKILNIILNFKDGFTLETSAKVISSNLQKDSQYKYDTRVEFLELKESERDKLINFIFEKQTKMLKKTSNSDAADNIYHMIYGDYEEKRNGKDIILKIVDFFAFTSWIVSFFIIVFLFKASPEVSYSIGRFFESDFRASWNIDLLNTTLIFSIMQVSISSVGLFLRSLRMKRETDKFNVSLLINLSIGIIVLSGIVYIFLNT